MPGPTPGPNPYPFDPDPDPTPDPADPEREVVGWWYKSGDGCSVSAARKVGTNYQFEVTIDGFAVNDSSIGINAYVRLSVSGGGMGLIEAGRVNWGFRDASKAGSLVAFTEKQRPDWHPAPALSSTAEDYRTIPCKVTGAVRQGKFTVCSNIRLTSDDAVLVKASGTYINRTENGKKVKYEICYITARKKRLQKLVAQNVLAACPLTGHTVTPGSVTGSITQSGEAAPCIMASASRTECPEARAAVTISAPWKLRYAGVRSGGTSTMAISHHTEWDAETGRYSADISATFTITLKEQTYKNY